LAAGRNLRCGITENPYITKRLTWFTALSEQLYWHPRNVHGPKWEIDYFDSVASDWISEETDFVDRAFNASSVLKERAEMIVLHEGMTYERDAKKRAPYA
jgi:hypothetical protein